MFLRKIAKLLEEKIILKHKDIFNVDNYEPNVEKLKRYKESLSNMKLYDMANNLDKIIVEIESKNKDSCSKKDKKKDEIKCKGDGSISKIYKTLDIIRRYCNNIIHFYPSKNIKFNLNDSLLSGELILKNDENLDDENNIKNEDKYEKEEDNILSKKAFKGTKEKKEIQQQYFVDISKTIDYIKQIHLPNQISEGLSKLEKNIKKI